MKFPDFLRRTPATESTAEADLAISSKLFADLDIRTRVERERENVTGRLDRLHNERETIARKIADMSSDLSGLDRIIEGMEAHLRIVEEAASVHYTAQIDAATASFQEGGE